MTLSRELSDLDVMNNLDPYMIQSILGRELKALDVIYIPGLWMT